MMSEEYGSNFISISDEEGNNYELEHVDSVEIGGEYYLAFLPADISEDDERYGLIIMKSVEENGEEFFIVPEENEIEMAYEKFMKHLFEDDAENEE